MFALYHPTFSFSPVWSLDLTTSPYLGHTQSFCLKGWKFVPGCMLNLLQDFSLPFWLILCLSKLRSDILSALWLAHFTHCINMRSLRDNYFEKDQVFHDFNHLHRSPMLRFFSWETGEVAWWDQSYSGIHASQYLRLSVYTVPSVKFCHHSLSHQDRSFAVSAGLLEQNADG